MTTSARRRVAFFADFFFAGDFFFGNFFFAASFFGAALLTVFFRAEGALLAADFFRVGFFLLTVFFLRAGFFLAMKKVYQTPTGRVLLASESHHNTVLLTLCQAVTATALSIHRFLPGIYPSLGYGPTQGRNW